MSAIGHTMASMSQAGSGKVNASSTSVSSSKGRGGSNNRPAANTYESNGSNSGAGRGQNINHLLAFTLPPRVSNSSIQAGARRPRRGGSSYVPFNKERYVNAQYRFLVKPTGDYTAYFADADIYLNWSDILTILIPTSSALSTASHVSAAPLLSQPSLETHEGATCPICLSRPTAPRMTKCGHVYCFPCILHYLTVHDAPAASGSSTPNAGPYHHIPGAAPRPLAALGTSPSATNGMSNSHAPKWKRCPVCWDAVYARDLKAVQWWDPKGKAQEFDSECEVAPDTLAKPASDEYLCMRLIERPHLTTLALPQSSTWPTASTSTSDQPLIAQHSAPWHFQPDVMTFGKFMLATPDLLLTNLNTDIVELATERELLQSFLTKDEVGLMFVDMAERKVQEQMEKVTNELDTQSVRSRIGYARKELEEHHQVEQGNRERDAEAISRRQRKRLERERRHESGGEGDGDGNEAGETQTASVSDSPEEPGTAQEFLDLQSRQQGGNSFNVASRKPADPDQSQNRVNRDGTRSGGPKTRKNLNPPAPSSSSFFFFQASSGQNIFLHPLDIKVLLTAYGSYAAFPRTLQVCVQGADEGSMNDEMRKRCKYLTHLSQGADIVFVEVDWDRMLRDSEGRQEMATAGAAAAVSRSVLRMYDQALRQRRNRRRDRERREDRAKLRSEEQERNSRPLMTTQPIGFGGSTRSPALSAIDAFESGSFGSQSALSPGMQEALLAAGLPVSEFPSAAQVVHAGQRGGSSVGHSDEEEQDDEAESAALEGVDDGEGGASAGNRGPRPRRSKVNASAPTVWGTPGPKGSFANALHSSTRLAGSAQQGRGESAPDWDAWLELEEDYIVGARSGNAVREGRGLNRQAKRGEQATGTVTPGKETVTPRARTPPKSEEVPARSKEAAVAQADATAEAPEATPSATTTGGKQQKKKKKLVLTSGGGGRGTR